MGNLSINDIVNVNVNVSKVSTALMTFNLGLIIGQCNVISTTQRVQVYSNLPSIIAAGFTTTSPEYLAAQLYFSQTPTPTKLAIGRWNYPTETALQAVAACRIANTDWYGVYICQAAQADIQAVAPYIDSATPTSTFFYTTHDSAVLNGTAGNVMVTLKSQLVHKTVGLYSTSNTQTAGYETGAVGGSTNISAGSATTFKIAIDGDATPHSITLTLTGLTTGALIASAMQTAIQALSPTYPAYANVTVAFTNNVYVITSGSTGTTSTVAITAGSSNDVAATLKIGAANGAVDTAGTITYLDGGASILGYAMGANTGLPNSAYTLMFKSLPGITTESLTEAQLAYIEGVNGNVYVNRGGTYNMLEAGVTSDGTFFDQILGLDLLSNNIQISIMNALQAVTKIPYTDAGVNILMNAISGPCEAAKTTGFIAPGVWTASPFWTIKTGDTLPSGYKIMADTVANQSAANIQARISPPIYVGAKLAGAIQHVNISVTVSN